jgi:ABC-type glycerol-3-phosphate transport system substrate-binding protein
MMKKVIVITALLSAFVLTGAFAGGDKEQGSGGAKKPEEIVFMTWNPGLDPAWDHIMQNWDAKNTGIKVTLNNVLLSDLWQSLKVLLASGEGPDMYGQQTGAVMKEFSEFSMDVAPRMAKEFGADWEKKFVPFSLSQTKGILPSYYGLPTGGGSAGYFWANLSYFDKYNVKIPTNLNELKAAAKTFRSRGELPCIIGAKDDWINIDMFMNIAMDFNAKLLFDAVEGRASFTDPVFIQTLTIWKSLFDEGVFQDGALGINVYNDAKTIFEDEFKGAMYYNGSWVVNSIDTMTKNSQKLFGVDPHYEVFTIDWNGDGKSAPVTPQVDVVVSLNKGSKHLEEAWQFFTWYCLGGVKPLIDERLQYFPILMDHKINLAQQLTETGGRYAAETQKNFDKIVDIVNQRAYGYREITYPRLKQTIYDQLKAVAIGESTPQQAAQIIEAASKAERR